MTTQPDPASPIEIITTGTPMARALGVDARARDSANIAGALLADFLTTDIQGSLAAATALAEQLDAPVTAPWRRSGNAFTISVTDIGVTITDDYPAGNRADSAIITHAEFAAGLRIWIDALQHRR